MRLSNSLGAPAVVILCYAIIHTLELFVYQVNVLFFDPLANPQTYAIKSATPMVILLIMNMIEYTFWFSCVYSCLRFLVEGLCPKASCSCSRASIR